MQALPPLGPAAKRLLARWIAVEGPQLAVIALYLDDQRDHLFVSRDNLAKLQAVLLLVKSLGVPFVIGGDFNMPPADGWTPPLGWATSRRTW